MRKEAKDPRLGSPSLLFTAGMLMAVAAVTIGGVAGMGTSERFIKAALFAIAAGVAGMSFVRKPWAQDVRLHRLLLIVAFILFAVCAVWFLATALMTSTEGG